MPGFQRDTTGSTDQNIVYADNVDFSGSTSPVPKINTNGQLLIGSAAPPNIQVGTLTSPGGTITIGYSSPNITLDGVASPITIQGDLGSITGTNLKIFANVGSLNCGSTVYFSNSGTTSLFNVTDSNQNTIIGKFSGGGAGNHNTGLGQDCIASTLVNGNFNTAIGFQSQLNVSTGNNNTAVGYVSLKSLTTGQSNVALGNGAIDNLISGGLNVSIGSSSGSNYTGSESSNILINSNGVLGESNTLRIGAGTGIASQKLTSAYISGINGVNVSSSTATVVTMTGISDQLGTATITAGSGVTVTPTANTITLSATAPTITGDSGSITGTSLTIFANQATLNSGSSVQFTNSGTTSTFNVTDANSNTIIGNGSGVSATGLSNTGLGKQVLSGLQAGGNLNTAVGYQSQQITTTGKNNTSIGNGSLSQLLTGSNNVAIGTSAALNYTGSESSNIIINNNGIIGESNVLRIGSGTGSGTEQLAAAYISGINGVNVDSATSRVVTMTGGIDQLGTATITAGSGISVTPTANTITIATSGATLMPWSDQSGVFTAAANNGYFITGASTATMPASPSQGNAISFIVDTASTLTITGNTGQKLRIGSALSASAGTAANNARGDCVTFVYRSTGTTWMAIDDIGTWTVT